MGQQAYMPNYEDNQLTIIIPGNITNTYNVNDVVHPRPIVILILLSDEVTSVLQYILLSAVCQAINVFGIASNIINIICLLRQNMADPINISFLGLAVSDICSLTALIFTIICYTPAFVESDLPFDAIEFQYLTCGIPHTVFTRVTGCITAFITLERCICVTVPLKANLILTARRVSIITTTIFIVVILCIIPEYIAHRMEMKFFPGRNKTLLGLVFSPHRNTFIKISYLLNNVVLNFGSFIIIFVCMIILVVQLQKNTKWRKKTNASKQADTFSSRNQKISKMVISISILFIACFVPVSMLYIGLSQEPEFFTGSKYINFILVLGSVGVLLESINSSCNIFIYFYMSQKYRTVFRDLFTCL